MPLPDRGSLLVAGTASGVGKSLVTLGLCRLFARQGVRVAPFKAQNMSNQSAVTVDGAEIGRAQHAQALAAGAVPEAAMNPVLLKPDSDTTCHVVVMGRPAGTSDALGYGRRAEALRPVVHAALDDLRSRYGVVIAEGAGGAAEVNLLDRDIVNLPLAAATGMPAIVVVDIERGGAFASALGTVSLLPRHLRDCIRAFVINRFRGDAALLTTGIAELERRTGVPTIGVVPWLDGFLVDEEDALDYARSVQAAAAPKTAAALDVAVVALPHGSNLTDLDPFHLEPGVRLRLVRSPEELVGADLIVIPGTRATVADLAWMRAVGLAEAVVVSTAAVLGVCGGYQMLGRTISDDGVESDAGCVPGLGLLPVDTVFRPEKVLRRVTGRAFGAEFDGYEVRHGRVLVDRAAAGWVEGIADEPGACSSDGRVLGTSVHGMLESDGVRHAFLAAVAARAGKTFGSGAMSYDAVRTRHHDRVADHLAATIDLDALGAIVAAGAPG